MVLPKEVEHWSLTTIREKLIKIGAKVVSNCRYVTFQMAEVAVSHYLLRRILRQIDVGNHHQRPGDRETTCPPHLLGNTRNLFCLRFFNELVD